MLWNLILDFYVRYIFGGCDSTGIWFSGFVGGLDYDPDLGTGDLYIATPFTITPPDYLYINLGNYLSLIATIITMILILVACFHIIKKCFNIFNRVF